MLILYRGFSVNKIKVLANILISVVSYIFILLFCYFIGYLTSLDKPYLYFMSVFLFSVPIILYSCLITTFQKRELLRKINPESRIYKFLKMRCFAYSFHIIVCVLLSFIMPVLFATFLYSEYIACFLALTVVILFRFVIKIFVKNVFKKRYVEYRVNLLTNMFVIVFCIFIYSVFNIIFKEYKTPVFTVYSNFINNKIAYTIGTILNNLNVVIYSIINNDFSQSLKLPIYMVLSIFLLQGGILFISLSRFVQFFYIQKNEYFSIFVPIEKLENDECVCKLKKSNLIFFLVFFFSFFFACSFFTYKISMNKNLVEYIDEKTVFLTEQISGNIYKLGTIAKIQTLGKEFSANSKKELIEHVNKYFNQMIVNCDKYLDWYYSLGHEYSELLIFLTGVATNKLEEKTEEFINNHMEEYLSPDIDLNESLKEIYDNLYTEFDNACKFILNKNRVTHSNSFYKITIQTNPEELYKSVEPKPIMKTQVKTGVSIGIGVGAGIATHYITKKMLKKLSTKMTSKAATKIVVSTAKGAASKTLSTSIGGIIGSAAGPVGTIVGTSVGFGIGILVDKLIISIDEAINRNEYKKEIINCIEEERTFYLNIIQQSYE